MLGDKTLSRLKEKDCKNRHAGKEDWKGFASMLYFLKDKGQFETYIMQFKLYVMELFYILLKVSDNFKYQR